MKIEILKKATFSNEVDLLSEQSLSLIKGGIAIDFEEAEKVSCRRGYSTFRCRCGYSGPDL